MSRHEYWINYQEVNKVVSYIGFAAGQPRKNYQPCCNCIEVNKYYKSKVTKYMIYNLNSGNTFKTMLNKDNTCKFCGHYVFYAVVDNKGKGV